MTYSGDSAIRMSAALTRSLMLPPPPGYTVGYRLQILMQPPVMITALMISVVTATISSILPAFKASRMKIVDALGHI